MTSAERVTVTQKKMATKANETVGEVLLSVLKGERSWRDVAAPPGVAWEALRGYVAGIDWCAEWRWLVLLVLCELGLLATAVGARRYVVVQGVLFFVCCGLVAAAQPLNTLLEAHWRSFATQPLFDPSGSFVALVYALPLLVVAVVCLRNLVAELMRLLVLRQRAIARSKASSLSKKKKSE